MPKRINIHRIVRAGFLVIWTLFIMGNVKVFWLMTKNGSFYFPEIRTRYILSAFALLICLDLGTYLKENREKVQENGIKATVLTAAKSIIQGYDGKTFLLYFVCAVLIWRPGHQYLWLSAVPLFLVSHFYEDKIWLKPVFFVFLARLVTQIGLYVCGYAEDKVMEFYYGVCHSLGFSNPNYTGQVVFFTFVLAWIIYGKRNMLWYGCSVLLGVVVFLVSGCRTAALLLVVLPIIHYIVTKTSCFSSKWFARLFVGLPLIGMVLSFILGIVLVPYDGSLDSSFLCRFVEVVYAFRDYGISLFYRMLPAVNRVYYFDNVYVQILFRNGLITLLSWLGLWCGTNHEILKIKNPKMITLCLCFFPYLMMEHYKEYISIIIFMALFAERRKENENPDRSDFTLFSSKRDRTLCRKHQRTDADGTS